MWEPASLYAKRSPKFGRASTNCAARKAPVGDRIARPVDDDYRFEKADHRHATYARDGCGADPRIELGKQDRSHADVSLIARQPLLS